MKRAFTLIEATLVLIILGIIGGLSIPLLRGVTSEKRVENTRKELESLKKKVIAYYQSYSKVPPHIMPGYKLNQNVLQVPLKYIRDPITGVDYLYFSDTVSTSDSIKVDGVPIGSIGCVLISAGPNGTFDGENATPNDFRFQSQGVDDILVSVSEYELKGTYQQNCQSYVVTITNNYGSVIYTWPTSSRDTCEPINPNQTVQFTGVLPFEYVLLSSANSFFNHQTSGFIPYKFDRGGNCLIRVEVRRIQNISVPVFTKDLLP
ncbi:MAG: hypothetical protein ABIL91_06775 [candidate division WOR-3 bacterium]